jgi:hypothetical protein
MTLIRWISILVNIVKFALGSGIPTWQGIDFSMKN